MPPQWCELANKRVYASHDQALVASAPLEAEGVRPYLCRYCYRWHIGHTWKAKRAQRRREARAS